MKAKVFVKIGCTALVLFAAITMIITQSVTGQNIELTFEELFNIKQNPLDSYYKGVASKRWADDEIIIKFKDSVSTAKSQSIISSISTKAKKLHANRIFKVKLNNISVEAAIQRYKNDPAVEYVQPNYIYHIEALPNDPGFSMQWGLKNTGQQVEGSYTIHNPGCSGCDIGMEYSWDANTNCRPITVAIIDTGVNYIHQDLKNNMWDGRQYGFNKHGYNFVEDNDDPMDYHGHGNPCCRDCGS